MYRRIDAGPLEISPMRRDEIDAVAALTARVFEAEHPDAAAAMLAYAYAESPVLRQDHVLVGRRDGRVVAKWEALDLMIRIGTTPVRAAGLHAILVDPSVEGEALGWQMVPAGIARLDEAGHGWVVGFAQRGAGYTRFGGRTVAWDYTWTLPLAAVPPRDAGSWRELDDAGVAPVVAWGEAAQSLRSGSRVREVSHWPWILRRPPEVFVTDDGYVGVRDGDGVLEVREACGGTLAFYRRALSQLARLARTRGHRSLTGHLPPDHPLVLSAAEFGARIEIEQPRRAGMIAAITDVARVLPSLQPMLEERWRRSRFDGSPLRLSVSCALVAETTSEITLGHGGPPAAALAIRASGGSLAALFLGHRTAAWLDDLEVTGPAGSNPFAVLDVLFPAQTVFLQHTDRW